MNHKINLEEQQRNIDNDKELRKTYTKIKAKYSDAIVLIRTGDEYITFKQDASLVYQIAGNCINEFEPTENICRFAFNALDTILIELVKAGNRVAICDQL